jgi:hypothetical protein
MRNPGWQQQNAHVIHGQAISGEDAMKVFNAHNTDPNLVDTGVENVRGSYGQMVRLERQEYEADSRHAREKSYRRRNHDDAER